MLQVHSGYRVTLTYNLYVEPVKEQVPDLTKIPLHQQLNDLLERKELVAEGIVSALDSQRCLAFLTLMCILAGGWLGFYAPNAYPHTSDTFTVDALKGLDLAMWHVFQALGCGVCLRPILLLQDQPEDPLHKFIGKSFHITQIGRDCEVEFGNFETVAKEWGLEEIGHAQVIWLKKAVGNEEFQVAYGTDIPVIEIGYSQCAILIGIPPYGEKGRLSLETPFNERINDGSSYLYTQT